MDQILDDVTKWVFNQLMQINNFEQIFLMIVAIVISKPVGNYANEIYLEFIRDIREWLGLKETDKLSNRSIISTLYLIAALIFWFVIGVSFPSLPIQQKIISTLALPIFSVIAYFVFFTVISIIYMLPYDLLVFAAIAFEKFSKKTSRKQ